jgi:hypothetical protein
MQQWYNCPRCGVPVAFGTQFCANCGADLRWPSQQHIQPTPPNYQQQQTGQWGQQPAQWGDYQQPSQSQPWSGRAYQQPQEETKHKGKAAASMVLGIIGLVAWLIPLFGVPITITGLVLGIVGLKSSKQGMAIAGIVMCVIELGLNAMNSLIGFMTWLTIPWESSITY